MSEPAEGDRTAGGVFRFRDFRANLIIDRYDVAFLSMRGAKTDYMRSEHSEDAVTWNVFRSLGQIDPTFWLPRLFGRAFGSSGDTAVHAIGVKLWPRVPPPPGLRLFQKDEGDSEIDVVIETERIVWFLEAKYRSDVSERTTNNPGRDQVVRNLDVGSWYAGVRDFYFSLLVVDPHYAPRGVELETRYARSHDELVRELRHRPDKLANVRGIGVLRWADVAAVLTECATAAPREDERPFATRAVEWLRGKSIAG